MPLRVEVQKHIATGVRARGTARRVSFRQFDRDTPLLAFTLRFVGTRRNGVATRFGVTLRGKDGRCRVGDRAGFGGSGNAYGQRDYSRKKFVGLLHDALRFGYVDHFFRVASLFSVFRERGGKLVRRIMRHDLADRKHEPQ